METLEEHMGQECYLSPSRGDIPASTPAKAGTRFSDLGGMQGWVDRCCVKVEQPGHWTHDLSIASSSTTPVPLYTYTSYTQHVKASIQGIFYRATLC